MHLTASAIDNLDAGYRVHLINSIAGFKSANLVGTVSDRNTHNLAIVSSVFHLGSDPALLGFISRAPVVDRHTLENIQSTGCYTINQVAAGFYKAAHQTSACYPRDVSEFEATGLTAVFSDNLKAPYVEQSPLKFGLELVESQTLAVNGTELVIGRLVELIVADAAVQADGHIDLEMLGTVTVSGLDSYHLPQRLARLSLAEPDRELRELKVDGSTVRGVGSRQPTTGSAKKPGPGNAL